ncbi:glycosyltransferase [Desulfosarcina sp. BuS5]|uniref:glycosyltransferase family 2 protein n=1 Tax=Desulfosarcina sp. BuS5 TaxID=933262 RepID=UPI000483D52A|nr:glycosyltransferase family 2 protein [Desulfosarcina sp. BuS5]WDN89435.1 glycosyltransferase [Desulfosarcina sp. BuS5]
MKISVITVCRNAEATISDTLFSVQEQSYNNIEHILIDGASSDGTADIIRKHERRLAYWVSEPDQGIYDAMNKGIQQATGDLVGFLNADDIFANNMVLEWIAKAFSERDISACYGDLIYVDHTDLSRVVRYYRSKYFTPARIACGVMPAHPTLYLKNDIFKKFGLFKTDYRIAADFEFIARIFGKQMIKFHYIPRVLVKMRMGGISTRSIKSNFILNQEIFRACCENNIPTSLFKVYSKYFRKIFELVQR